MPYALVVWFMGLSFTLSRLMKRSEFWNAEYWREL